MLGSLDQTPTSVTNQNIGILVNLPGANLLKFPNNPKFYPFNSKDFQYPERIFANKQSVVEKYLHTPSGHELAIKFIRIHYDQTYNHHESALKELQTEIEIHQKVAATSGSIVSFYGFCVCGDHILICMELMNMSLRYFYMWLHRTKIVSGEEALWHIAVSVIKALKVCKENNVMHRDIKPLNILVNSRGEIKLCDFGVSKILNDSKASTLVGTVAYWPPESFTDFELRYDFRAEIWSLGVTILEFIMGKLPYAQNEDDLDMITAQKLIKEYKFAEDKILDSYSEDLKSFIESCLRPVSERPTLEKLVNMEVYKSHENYLLSEEYYEFVKHAIESQEMSIVVTQLSSTYASNEGLNNNPNMIIVKHLDKKALISDPILLVLTAVITSLVLSYFQVYPTQSVSVSESPGNNRNMIIVKRLDKKALISDPSLLSAVRENNVDLVRTLLEQCADPNIKDIYRKTALHIAALNKDDNKWLVELLLEYGADIDSQDEYGSTCLMAAAFNNNIEIVRCLLQNGADINKKDRNGENVLHYAARNENDNKFIIDLLLKNGADIDSHNEYGKTCLMYAAFNSNIEIVRCLLQNGSDINRKNTYGYNVLHYAAGNKNDNKFIIELLIEYGVDIDSPNEDGYTCLMKAAEDNNIEIVRCLLQNGADINKQNRFGETAIQIARPNGKDYKEIVELLMYYEEEKSRSFFLKIYMNGKK